MELVFVNINAIIAHPMHIHGYNMEIVGMDQMWNYFTIQDFKRLDAQGKSFISVIERVCTINHVDDCAPCDKYVS